MHKRRLLTGLAAIPVFLVCLFHPLGTEFTLLTTVLFATLSAIELWRILVDDDGKVVFCGLLLVIWGLLLAAYFRSIDGTITVLIVGIWFVSFLLILVGWRDGRRILSSAYFLVFYLAAPLAALVAIRTSDVGVQLTGFVMLVSCACDTGGYYIGSFFGRRRLAPALSPNKTVEGGIAGLLFCLLGVAVWGFLQGYWVDPGHLFWMPLEPMAWMKVLALALIVGVLAQVGDLLESMLKRDAGVKDSGNNSTGHGGYLDMLDSLLWASPAMFLFAVLTGHL
jgi:phosphatidate cytidylyltransferase